MRSGVIILIVGGVLLAAGLVIAGLSTFVVTKQVLEGSTIIDKTSLEPNLSLAATIKDLPQGHQLLISLSSDPTDVPLQAKISAPDGTTLALYNITKTPFSSSVTTRAAGDHTIEIKNVGSRIVSVSGAILNSPIAPQGGGVSIQDDPSVQSLVTYGIGILAGIVLIISGIILLIIGTIKYVRAGKSAPPPGPASA